MKNLVLLALLVIPLLSYTQDQNIFLSLNTDMHTATINRIDTDAQGKYVLTCSQDKTAKLWDSRTGQLLQTYRPPRGNGSEGMLYAAAISADGAVVAIGGWSKSRNNDIYIFDTSTGALQQRITGLPNVIFDLEFSPNGRYLAAALGAGEGIRVYRNGSFQEVFMDSDYGNHSYNIAFAPDGRLASVSYDGYIRLYDSDFSILKKVETTGGSQPFSLAFSPDGDKLAVGYRDSPRIQVLDVDHLSLLYEPDISNATTLNERFQMVTFSKDGQQLIAGGFYDQYKNGKRWWQIRIWEQAGKGSYRDYNACDNIVMDIKVLPNGNILYAGADPDWGILDAQTGEQLLYKPKELYEYGSTDLSHFKISRAGYELGITPLGESALSFDIQNRKLLSEASNMPSYKEAYGELEASNWKNTYAPKLNGKPLSFLKKNERCRSVDVANDGEAVVFGADYGIYKIDASGATLWNTPTQAVAWVVNITGNNQVVAAALSNGQIRWYCMSDGEQLLSLYLHPDGKRWVLWTPSGYYDASPGAAELIGWHVNQGEDQAGLFFPLDRFKDGYYRPDVIDFILEELDETKALARADELSRKRPIYRNIADNLPPKVRILSPRAGSELNQNTVTLRYNIQSPNNEQITGVKILLNNRPIGATRRGLKPSGTNETVNVTIPSQDCTLSVLAENEHGWSEAASVQLKWTGSSGITQDLLKPSLYVLAVGISDYANMEAEDDLNYADKDAREFAAAFARQEGGLYKKVVTRVLTESDASKNNILDGLDWIVKTTTSRDIAILFFAGHGVDNSSGTFYFLPHQGDVNALRRSGVMKADIQDAIASIPGKVLTFIDACHSGSLMQGIRRGEQTDINRFINEIRAAENGAITFSSSTSRQYSLEDAAWQNGAFTEALLEGLNGRAAKTDGSITCKSLDFYIVERVKALTKGEQAPVTNYPPNTQDFPIAVKR